MSDIFRIHSTVFINKYHILFSYTTKRDNNRERRVEVEAISEERAKMALFIYVESYNEKHGCRSMGNVEILSIDCIDGRSISL